MTGHDLAVFIDEDRVVVDKGASPVAIGRRVERRQEQIDPMFACRQPGAVKMSLDFSHVAVALRHQIGKMKREILLLGFLWDQRLNQGNDNPPERCRHGRQNDHAERAS